MTFLSLKEYLTGARRIMLKQKCGYLVNDEDAVSHVAYRMMLADQTWDGSSGRDTWRYNQARYAILRVITKKKKEKGRNIKSLDYGWDMKNDDVQTLSQIIPDRDYTQIYEQFDDICECANKILKGRKLQCFNLYYKDQRSMEEVGKKLGITKQAVSLHVINSIKEIKKWMLSHD